MNGISGLERTMGGLNRYDLGKEWFTSYTVADGLLSNDIKVIYVDEQAKRVYVGAHASGGLNVLDLKTGRILSFLPEEGLQTGRGFLWHSSRTRRRAAFRSCNRKYGGFCSRHG